MKSNTEFKYRPKSHSRMIEDIVEHYKFHTPDSVSGKGADFVIAFLTGKFARNSYESSRAPLNQIREICYKGVSLTDLKNSKNDWTTQKTYSTRIRECIDTVFGCHIISNSGIRWMGNDWLGWAVSVISASISDIDSEVADYTREYMYWRLEERHFRLIDDPINKLCSAAVVIANQPTLF